MDVDKDKKYYMISVYDREICLLKSYSSVFSLMIMIFKSGNGY